MLKRTIYSSVLAVALVSLTACGTVKALSAAVETTVSARTVQIAETTFDAAQDAGKTYILSCLPSPMPAGCSDAGIEAINKALKSGREIRNTLDAFMVASPNQPVAKSDFDKLESVIGSIKSIAARYMKGNTS